MTKYILARQAFNVTSKIRLWDFILYTDTLVRLYIYIYIYIYNLLFCSHTKMFSDNLILLCDIDFCFIYVTFKLDFVSSVQTLKMFHRS